MRNKKSLSAKQFLTPDIISVLLLILVVAVLFFPAMTGLAGIFHNDLFREDFPRFYFLSRNLQAGVFPLWDPSIWCGASPFYAVYHADTYYILNWPFFMLADLKNLAHSYWFLVLLPQFAHYALAAAGFYFFLKRALRCSTFPAYFGALAYIFSPALMYAHVWPQFVTLHAWLPWLFLTYFSSVKKFSLWKIIAGGVLFSLVLISGQVSFFHFVAFLWSAVLIFLVLNSAHKGIKKAIKSPLTTAFLMAAIGMGLSSFYLVSSIEGSRYSDKHLDLTVEEALSHDPVNVPPPYLATLFIPNLFSSVTGEYTRRLLPQFVYYWEANMSGGMAVSLLVLLSLLPALRGPPGDLKAREKRRWVIIFGGVYIIALLAAMGKHTPFYRYIIGNLPFVRNFPFPSRYRVLQCFAVAVLAPVSLDYIISSKLLFRLKDKLKPWVWVYVAAVFMISAAGLIPACYPGESTWSEPPLKAAENYYPIGEALGRYSPDFKLKKIGAFFDSASSGEIRFGESSRGSPEDSELAAEYYVEGEGWYTFDVEIPPGKFVWLRQKSGNAGLGYEEQKYADKSFFYDSARDKWSQKSGVTSIYFKYTDKLAVEKQYFYERLKDLRKPLGSSLIYWVLVSAVIISGLYFLPLKKFGYLLGIIAMGEFLILGTLTFYKSNFDEPDHKRFAWPHEKQAIQVMTESLPAVTKMSDMRLATSMPYFDSYVRITGESALMGFSMHPIEARFKKAFETAYDMEIGWDIYYDLPDPRNISFLNNFSVRYMLNEEPDSLFSEGDSVKLPCDSGFFVHTNHNALPRVFTADRIVLASEEEQLNQLVEGNLRRGVYVSTSAVLPSRAEDNIGEAYDEDHYFDNLQQKNRIVNLNMANPNRIKVDVEINEPSILVLTEIWYPGWEVYVNGNRAPILRVNYCQRGVWVEEGVQSVVFKIRPIGWVWGIRVFMATAALLLVITGYALLKKKAF